MKKVGDVAPPFEAASSSGKLISLAALRGQWVVVYFYPKAFTPGCTVETKRFRDNYADLRALGAEVVGISVDELAQQCRFASEHGVTFPLVSDEHKSISKDYGVLWPMIGLDKRVTFMIDPDGVIRAVFRHEIQISKHLDDVLRFLRQQNGTT